LNVEYNTFSTGFPEYLYYFYLEFIDQEQTGKTKWHDFVFNGQKVPMDTLIKLFTQIKDKLKPIEQLKKSTDEEKKKGRDSEPRPGAGGDEMFYFND
jgi:hypothetical protein